MLFFFFKAELFPPYFLIMSAAYIKKGSVFWVYFLDVIHWSKTAEMGISVYLISSSLQGRLGIISVHQNWYVAMPARRD